eukprot:2632571-Alexandrium_andersonii.AAC.1
MLGVGDKFSIWHSGARGNTRCPRCRMTSARQRCSAARCQQLRAAPNSFPRFPSGGLPAPPGPSLQALLSRGPEAL